MTTIMPEGDAIRKAIKWISASIEEASSRSVAELTREAITRFDLSPKDADFLIRFYRDSEKETAPGRD